MDKKANAKKKDDQGLRKEGRSRRARAGNSGRGRPIPRVMILAGLLIVVAAAWLYWPSGSSEPTGLGEQRTIVTDSLNAAPPATAPGSGDVDINEQTADLTPETPAGGEIAQVVENPAGTAEEKVAAAAETAEEKTEAAPPPAKKTEPVTPREPVREILPQASGSYAVQIGSFGNADNADSEVNRLKELGWDTRVRAGNNSDGQMVFRVWITWFASRQEAQKFIDHNRKHVPGAIPVHR